MAVDKLKEKLKAAEEKVAKCEKTIERHRTQLDKRILKAKELGCPISQDEAQFQNYWSIYDQSGFTHEQYWAICDVRTKLQDIKGALKKYDDAKRIATGWKEKLDIEINKEKVINETVPQVIKDFLEKWKTDAFSWYVERYDLFIKFKADLREKEYTARLEAYNTLPEYANTRERYASFLGDKAPDYSTLINLYPRTPVEEFLKERDLDYKSIRERVKNFGDGIIFKMSEFGDKDERLEFLENALEKEKKAKLLSLVNSITAITGPITDAKHLYVSGGELNGVILGEKGVAKIQTFSAGGYNIQCFHYRTRVDDVTEKYRDDASLYTIKKEEKRYFVNDDYPAETWEDILGLTTEAARRILNDDEFTKWYKERNERFPGCYLPLEHWMDGSQVRTYQFPRFAGGDDMVAMDYGLEVISNTNDDTIVKGQYRDIEAFADQYLGYQLVPEYLKPAEEERPRLDEVITKCAQQVNFEPNVKSVNKQLEK